FMQGFLYTTLTGKKLLASHGDKKCFWMRYDNDGSTMHLGDTIYNALLDGDRGLNRFVGRDVEDPPIIPLASPPKTGLRHATNFFTGYLNDLADEVIAA